MIKNIKDAVWQRKHLKKKATLQSFGKKTKTTRIFLILIKNIPYTDKDLGNELVIVVIDDRHCGIFIIPKEVAISKKILSTKDCKGKMAMRFYPSWCTNLNKTAQATQKWQLDYFQKIKLEE